MTSNRFYVYEHYIPGRGVFYVGKGCNKRASERESRNQYWHNVVNKNGGEFHWRFVATNLSEELAYDIELQLINSYLSEGTELTNLRIKNNTRIYSNEALLKMSETNKGLNNPAAKTDIFNFEHKSGKTFVGTICDFYDEFGFRPYKICNQKAIDSGKLISEKGWHLQGKQTYSQTGLLNKMVDVNIYKFINYDGTVFIGHRVDFDKKFGIKCKRLFGKKPMKNYYGWIVDKSYIHLGD